VYRSYSREGPFIIVGETRDRSFVDPVQASASAAYVYRASLVDPAGGEGPMSEPVAASSASIQPLPPDSLAVKIEDQRFRLTWRMEPTIDVAGFNVYRIDQGAPVRVASLSAPPYVADWPDSGIPLRFRVRAISVSSHEESDWSDTIEVKRP